MESDRRNLSIRAFDLSSHPEVLEDLLEGQECALRNFGVGKGVISKIDRLHYPGTFAITVQSPIGEIIGGLRIYSRHPDHALPIEAESSPLEKVFRDRIRKVDHLHEVRGLWVAPHAAGQFLSRKVVAYGTALSYRLGAKALVGFAHLRSFDLVVGPVGYKVDQEIPSIEYPNGRFRSVVVWHLSGAHSLKKNLEKVGLARHPDLIEAIPSL